MHRTQLMFEDRQYRSLLSRCRRERRSLSSLVRDAVDVVYGSVKKGKTHRLEDVAGIFSDPGGLSGRDHDLILYGWDKRKSK